MKYNHQAFEDDRLFQYSIHVRKNKIAIEIPSFEERTIHL